MPAEIYYIARSILLTKDLACISVVMFKHFAV